MTDKDRQWFIAGRWQEYEGEARANLLRVAGIALFYLVELLNYHGLDLGPLQYPKVPGVDRGFHLAMTALAAAWAMTGWGVWVCLERRVFPQRLKYLSTAADLLLMTCVLLLADGPRSPLLACYFIIVCLSALRFSVRLVRMATAGAILGYIALIGHAFWYRPAVRVPRHYEVIFILTLALCGVVLGQTIRRFRAFAEDYARRLGAAGA